ncbi:glycosyltransferase [Nostoc sp. XA013]|nr:glycosyltransferase [Nostoc sp. XA013]
MNKPLASIIITNYNYERFLSEAIESALSQSYQPTEVIVVDDGSTDNSRQIIANYRERIILLLKENGGQGSAFNAGFEISQGEIICFLDADDILLPGAIERAVELLHDPNVVQVHWPLSAIDAYGKPLGKLIPDQPLPEGDLRDARLKKGIEGYVFSPTSGNAWSRRYLKQILPLSADQFCFSADSYLTFLAPFFGTIKRIVQYQALYRIHGQNGTSKCTYSWQLNQYQKRITALYEHLHQQGIQKDDFEQWESSEYSYLQTLIKVSKQLEPFIPPGKTYILVDMDEWGSGQLLENCQSIPFLEKDGLYWGAPSDNATAIEEFERLRHEGASFIVFGWPAFWWFDYYIEFCRYLHTMFHCVLNNEHLIVFDLQSDVCLG